jgi:predicted amidohydrolase YtcJ
VAEAKARGFRVASHAIGNAAIDMVLDAYSSAKPESARIEHATFITDTQIAKIADLGAAVVTQPYFMTLPAIAQAPSIPGIGYQPLRSMLQAGVCVAGSSDFPVTDFDPMLGIRAAQERKTRLGEVRDPDERLSEDEAIRLYTRNAAQAAGCLDRCGTLDIGKRADLMVLDGDKVTATVIGGELRFGAL